MNDTIKLTAHEAKTLLALVRAEQLEVDAEDMKKYANLAVLAEKIRRGIHNETQTTT